MTTHIPLEQLRSVLVEGNWIDVNHDSRPDIATVLIDLPGTIHRQPLLEGPAGGGPYLSFTGADGDRYAFPVAKISGWRFTA